MQEARGAGGMQAVIRGQIQSGLSALQQGRHDEAKNIFSTLLEANPQLAMAHVGLGRAFSGEGDHQRALEHFQAALEIKPDFAAAMMFAAQAREKLGDGENAMSDYKQAVELDPSLGLGHQRMARLMVKEDRPEEALATLQEAVTRSPQDASLRLMLANTMERAGQDAKDEYRRVIDMKPDLWIAHYHLGRALLQDNEFTAARDSLARAASLDSEKPQVQQALGSAYTGMGDHARAAKAYDEAFRLKPSNLRAAVKAAQSRSALGKNREALDLLLNLGRMSRRSSIVQKAIGDIQFAMGKWQDAGDSYVAMILNADDMEEKKPELVALAKNPGTTDAEARARKLQAALGEEGKEMGERLRANPKLVRDWIKERRGAKAGAQG